MAITSITKKHVRRSDETDWNDPLHKSDWQAHSEPLECTNGRSICWHPSLVALMHPPVYDASPKTSATCFAHAFSPLAQVTFRPSCNPTILQMWFDSKTHSKHSSPILVPMQIAITTNIAKNFMAVIVAKNKFFKVTFTIVLYT